MNIVAWLNNRQKILSISNVLLDLYLKDTSQSLLSCKDDIISYIKKAIDEWKGEVSKWNSSNTDYYLAAHNLIIDRCTSALDHGSFSFGFDMNSSQYRHLLQKCAKWEYEHEYLSKDDYKQCLHDWNLYDKDWND